jgi:hypothetical protein
VRRSIARLSTTMGQSAAGAPPVATPFSRISSNSSQLAGIASVLDMMRFISSVGLPPLAHVGALAKPPIGPAPWFAVGVADHSFGVRDHLQPSPFILGWSTPQSLEISRAGSQSRWRI